MTKKQLRAEFLVTRNHIDPTYISSWSESIAKRVISHFIEPSGPHHHWALYDALTTEVQTEPLINALWTHQKICLLPRIHSQAKRLDFYRYNEQDPLIKHPVYNIVEPRPLSEALKPDMIITPLLAFDRSGRRLGFGGGFYDRTLAYYRQLSSAPKAIGLAFSIQEAALIPTEPHDESLDYIVTEREVITI